MNAQFKKGVLELVVLESVRKKDMYGYEMISTLRERSQNVFELKAGSLYPLLHNLEGKNIVASYEKEVLGKVRKYYHITKEGHALLVQKQKEWNEYVGAVADVMLLEV